MLSPISTDLATLQAWFVALILVALLMLRQSLSGLDELRIRRLRRSLNAIIVPLMIVFLTQVVVKLARANAEYFEKHGEKVSARQAPAFRGSLEWI